MKRTFWNYQANSKNESASKKRGSVLNLIKIAFFLFLTLFILGLSGGILSWYRTESFISLIIITDESIFDPSNNTQEGR